MLLLYHLGTDYSSSSRIPTLTLRKHVPEAGDLAEADAVESEETLDTDEASEEKLDEAKHLNSGKVTVQGDKKSIDSIMDFVKSIKASVVAAVEGDASRSHNEEVSIFQETGEISATRKKQKSHPKPVDSKPQERNKSYKSDNAQEKTAPLIKKKIRSVSKLSPSTRLKTTNLSSSEDHKKEIATMSKTRIQKSEGNRSDSNKKTKKKYKQNTKVIFPHSFDKLEANEQCRPKKLDDKPYIYKPKPNPWKTEDVNTKSTDYSRKLISPYANISKADIDRWGENCHKKCPYFECSTARASIDDTLKLVLKEWTKLTSATGELNILTVNAFGSLVASLWRGNYLMQWDTDFDYLIWAHDTEKLEQFMDEYNARKDNPFKLSVQPDWRCKFDEYDNGNWGGRRYYNAKGKKVSLNSKSDGHSGVANYVAPNARLIHKEKGLYVDIWPMYAGNHTAVGSAKYEGVSTAVTFNDINYRYPVVPRNEIFPLQQCFLGSLPTWCPSDGARAMERYFHINRSSLAVPDHYLDYDTGCWVKKKRI